MPLYEYRCKECGSLFDALRPIKDADKTIACKQCSSESTERQISVFFAQSAGRVVAGANSSGCAGCSGGSCASCGH